eukprot:11583181-Ditylum_brightwellii.AAC.1
MTVINFAAVGGIPYDKSYKVEAHNGRLLNITLQNLLPGETLLIKGEFHLMGGIISSNLKHVIIQLDGALIFSSNVKHWPYFHKENDGHHTVLECIHFITPNNITLTSTLGASGGILNGQGKAWW